MVNMPRNKSILLIDDNQACLESMRLALTKSGFECRTASSLETARALLQNRKSDVIVCDYFMPDTDGETVLGNLGMIDWECLLILTSSYPLEIKFKKGERFLYVDKLGLLDWLREKYSAVHYV